MARAVLSFDLCPDGSLVYADGSAIYHLGLDGKRTRLCTGQRIVQVVALSGAEAPA